MEKSKYSSLRSSFDRLRMANVVVSLPKVVMVRWFKYGMTYLPKVIMTYLPWVVMVSLSNHPLIEYKKISGGVMKSQDGVTEKGRYVE